MSTSNLLLYHILGCSDSRVVPETITQLGFGQIFVHRNIANQFNANDLNCMSELEFAVNNVKVDHIIVCGKLISPRCTREPSNSKIPNDFSTIAGHTKCVGVMNACNDSLNLNLKAWLSDIRKVKDKYPELF